MQGRFDADARLESRAAPGSRREVSTVLARRSGQVARERRLSTRSCCAVDSYVNRGYTPLAERASACSHTRRPRSQPHPHRRQSAEPAREAIMKTALKIYAATPVLLRGEVAEGLGGAGDAAFQRSSRRTQTKRSPSRPTRSSRTCGASCPRPTTATCSVRSASRRSCCSSPGAVVDFARRLLQAVGERDLALEQEQAMQALQATVKMRTAQVHGALRTLPGASTMPRAEFIVDAKLVTLPSDDAATVKETPPFMRWNAAFLDMPGPGIRRRSRSTRRAARPKKSPTRARGVRDQPGYPALHHGAQGVCEHPCRGSRLAPSASTRAQKMSTAPSLHWRVGRTKRTADARAGVQQRNPGPARAAHGRAAARLPHAGVARAPRRDDARAEPSSASRQLLQDQKQAAREQAVRGTFVLAASRTHSAKLDPGAAGQRPSKSSATGSRSSACRTRCLAAVRLRVPQSASRCWQRASLA